MGITVTPYLVIDGAAGAIEFFEKAFGARETMRLAGPNGRIGHAEMRIGEALIMVADEHPDMGIRGPRSLGGSAVTLVMQVPDVDATAAQAVAAGAKVVFPVKDQFYGERSGRFEDPFGHVWILSTHIRDMSTAEMQQRYEQLLAEQPQS